MPYIAKAQSHADLLAMVPHLVGFTPRNSMVLLVFDGSRTSATIRLDLPPEQSAAGGKRFANAVIGLISRLPRGQGVIVVVCTDERFGAGTFAPHAGLVEPVLRSIRRAGFDLRGALCHAADGWAAFRDEHVPPGGHPLAEIYESPLGRELPDAYRAEPGEGDTAPITEADAATKRRMTQEVLTVERLQLSERQDEDSLSDLSPMESIPRFCEQSLSWDDEEFELLAPGLLALVQDPGMRDLAMMQWASDLPYARLLLALVNGSPGQRAYGEKFANALMRGQAPRPDALRVERAIALLVRLVGRAEDPLRPPVLLMLAWLNWGLGRGSRAGAYLDIALRLVPTTPGLVQLELMIADGELPDWAFDDDEPLPGEEWEPLEPAEWEEGSADPDDEYPPLRPRMDGWS